MMYFHFIKLTILSNLSKLFKVLGLLRFNLNLNLFCKSMLKDNISKESIKLSLIKFFFLKFFKIYFPSLFYDKIL